MSRHCLIDLYKKHGCTIEIHADHYAADRNPRDYDNVGALVTYSRRARDLDELDVPSRSEFDSWEEFDAAVEAAYPGCIALPVYRYEHGGVAYSTVSFNDPWDSGRVGIIVATRDRIAELCGADFPADKVREALRSEIEEYSKWANGEVYGYVVRDGVDGRELDSCWGIIGMEWAKSEADAYAAHHEKTVLEAGPDYQI